MNKSLPPGPLLIDVAGHDLDSEDRELLTHPAVGGAILFTRNCEDVRQLRALTDAMRACRPNLLVVADYEGGRVQRFRYSVTVLPAMRRLGGLWQDDAPRALALATDIGWLVASELRALGVAMPLAPVVDVDYGQSSVIGDRAFAADAAAVTALAQALMTGLRQGGSVATAKHYPGHGAVAPDSHVELPVDLRELTELDADLAPYRMLIGAGLASIMMAHIRYPAVDELPASLSPRWIRDQLRGQLGFDGCVFCDDLSMGGAAALGGYSERTGLALEAGCNYLPVCNNRDAVRKLVEDDALRADDGPNRREQLHARCAPSGAGATLHELRSRERWRRTNESLRALTPESR